MVKGPDSMLARGSEFRFSRRKIIFTCCLISASSCSDCSSSTDAARGTPSSLAICVDLTILAGALVFSFSCERRRNPNTDAEDLKLGSVRREDS